MHHEVTNVCHVASFLSNSTYMPCVHPVLLALTDRTRDFSLSQQLRGVVDRIKTKSHRV